MSIFDGTCCKTYTSSGTNHAPYSTPCGHLMAKKCLGSLLENEISDQLQFPFCHPIPRFSESHSTYELLYKMMVLKYQIVTERSSEERHTIENIQQSFDFKEYFTKHVNGSIDLFDVNKEYVLISGISSSILKHRFYRFINVTEKIIHNKTEIIEDNCSAVALNKHQNDTLEYCIGYKDGFIKYVNRSLNFKNVISKTEIFYDQSFKSVFFGNSKIRSICFLDRNKVVFSVGKGVIRLWDNCDSKFSKTKVLKKFPSSECGKITDLKSLNSYTCFGKMNDKIYAFHENKDSYVVCYEVGREIVTYTIDPTTSTLVVFYSNRNFYDDDKNSMIQSYVTYKIEKKKIEINGQINERFTTSIIKIFLNNNKEFPVQLKMASLFNVKKSNKYFSFGLVPNIKKNELEIVSLNGIGKSIKNMIMIDKNCYGISLIDEKGLCFGKNSLFKVAVIYTDKVVIMNINYSSETKKSI